MLSTPFLVVVVLSFFAMMAVLFWLTPRLSIPNQLKTPIFSLSLGVHCTSWAMLGTVAQAAQHQWAIFPTYLGIMFTMILGHSMVQKVSVLSAQSNSASLADFMASRWPHVGWYGTLVTLLACVTVIPYIALQLMALTNIGELLLNRSPQNLGLWVTVLLIISIGLLSFSRGSLLQQGQSILLLSAISSIIKLTALLSVLMFINYALFDNTSDFVLNTLTTVKPASNTAWISYASYCLLGLSVVFCSPRQFHMAFVFNRDNRIFGEARWQFSAFLLGMGLPILPIALAGQYLFNEQVFSAELYTLAIPLFNDAAWLSALVVLGVLAAAVPMILVATISCSVMLANNVVSPIWVKRNLNQVSPLTHKRVLNIRRITIVSFLIAAYVFFEYVAQYTELVFSGFVALALITQLLPSFIASLYIQRPNVIALSLGIASGVTVWIVYLSGFFAFDEVIISWVGAEQALPMTLFISTGLNAFVIAACQHYLQAKLPYYNAHSEELKYSEPSNASLSLLMTLCDAVLPKEEYKAIDRITKTELRFEKARNALVNRVGLASTNMLIDNAQQYSEQPNTLLNWVQETQELSEAKRIAEAENKSKTRFLAAAGHDLMQPFNAAQLLSNILYDKTKDTPQHKIAHDLQDALKHAGTLLTSLLDVTKLDSGVMKARPKPFKLDPTLFPLIREFSVIAKAQNVTLHYVQSSVWLKTDPNLFLRCCQNLIANAIRYTAMSHPTGGGKIVIGCKRYANKVYLHVIDNGPGIPAEQHKMIFDEFTQLGQHRGQEGLGIGLTIVKGICELLNIKIKVKSQPQRGSLFALDLPIVNQTNVISNEPVSMKESRIFQKQLLLWLVENDNAVGNAMLRLAEHWGMEARWFKNQIELCDAIQSDEYPDVMILDYHLHDGELGTRVWDNACVEWQNRGRIAPVGILATADRSTEVRETANDLGLTYLPKPIKADVLKRIIINKTTRSVA